MVKKYIKYNIIEEWIQNYILKNNSVIMKNLIKKKDF